MIDAAVKLKLPPPGASQERPHWVENTQLEQPVNTNAFSIGECVRIRECRSIRSNAHHGEKAIRESLPPARGADPARRTSSRSPAPPILPNFRRGSDSRARCGLL
jgi:hypothetical protein